MFAQLAGKGPFQSPKIMAKWDHLAVIPLLIDSHTAGEFLELEARQLDCSHGAHHQLLA